jgi:iron complex outermembrane recepter protein
MNYNRAVRMPLTGINRPLRLFQRLALVWVAALCISPEWANSQTTDPESANRASATNELGEIVVTAQKRVESSQKTATAVTVVSGETLANLGITNVLQLTNILPSARFNSENTEMKLFIRGVGTDPGYIWIPESVSVFVNGGFMQRFGSIASFFDISSAQVLPGPQGTLYGRNSIGGTIQITTNRPQHELESSATLEYGNYDFVHTSLAVNAPVNDRLAVRAAFDYQAHSGYQTNGDDTEGAYAGRLSALWNVTDDFTGFVWAQYWQNNFHNASWQNLPYPNPRDPWYVPAAAPSFAGMAGEVTFQPLSRVHSTTFGGQFDWHVANMTLSYIPFGYNFNTNEHRPVDGFDLPWKSRINEYSQELRLSSDANDTLTWVGGLTWLKSNGDLYYTFGPNLAGYDGTTNLKSYAAYGQATLSLTSTLRNTVGLRYSWDEVSAPNSNIISTDGFATGNFAPVLTPFSFSHNWKHFDWKEGLEADVGEHSLLYGSVQTGYTAGTFNPINNTAGFSNVVRPQTLLAFTIGTKNRFLDNRLQINDEVFFYRYHDLELAAFSGVTGVATVYNAPRSEIKGNQLDIQYQLTNLDRLTLGLGLLHGEIRSFTTDTGVSYAGYLLPNAPQYTVNLGLDHKWPIDGGANVTLRVDSLISHGFYALYSHDPYTYQNAYTKTGAALTYYSASGKWDVGLWGRNLENVATLAAAGAGGLPGPSASYIDPPRTYGVKIDAKF